MTTTDPSELPGVLAEIAGLAGTRAALDLALALGGQPAHIPLPQNLSPDHPLAVAMGTRAGSVCERFGGESLYIPIARRALCKDLAAQGMTQSKIARRLGVSVRTVRRHLR